MADIGLAWVNPAPFTKPENVVNFAKKCKAMGCHSMWTIDNSRGNQGQRVYKDAQDHRRFETLMGEVVKRHSLKLYAYVLMPNHFHLLIEVSRAPLAKAMQSLLYRHAGRWYRVIAKPRRPL
jgi:REP element-mobilizing transposase RayT